MFPKCIDLTSLYGVETKETIQELCWFALENEKYIAGVCVNTQWVKDVYKYLGYKYLGKFNLSPKIKVVTVVNFPKGLFLNQFNIFPALEPGFRLDVLQALYDGAEEIDMPIDWQEIKKGCSYVEWQTEALKDLAPNIKIILETGELTHREILKACKNALYGGANFLKTSTGKTSKSADFQAVRIMCEAIRDYYLDTGRMVGIKPSGGIKTLAQCNHYIEIVKEILHDRWLKPEYFRLGVGYNAAVEIIKELNT